MQLSVLLILLTAGVASAKFCIGASIVCVYGEQRCAKSCYKCSCPDKMIFREVSIGREWQLTDRYCSVFFLDATPGCPESAL
ncbi:hypothetical protein Ptr902_04942 [Pyrenophora tritici-repentis]|uniref:Uncharacterized protein n=1 Tax=Pyrenophora tritici-repentis TaxID=45151 RepID=A0A834VTZ4_9PLEO|nr:hypothetical protein A1F99_041130 [Pyrenophora tritici-repentis]KAF7574539.1 hypothetical protein PtrM4_061620 [Pyrenophora tritici-repentis]KAI2482626.1 hypothetical protein Ptr902_04942 [Pyrenophora tritici-repentis]